MRKILLSVLSLLVSILITVPVVEAGEAIYRWVDKDGNVHFSDQAPEGVESSQVNVKPNVVPLTQPVVNTLPNPESQAPGKEGDAEVPAEQLSYAQQRRQDRSERRRELAEKDRVTAANCEVMRTQKAQVEPSTRIMVDDGKGGVRRLEDSERQSLLNEANTFIAENCN